MPSVSVKEVWREKDSKPCAAANKKWGGYWHIRQRCGASYFYSP